MIERTLVLVKPDGVQRAIIGRIISRFEDAGLKVVAIKMSRPDRELAGRHYIADQKWFEDTGNRTLQSYKEKGIILKESAVELATRVRNYLIEFLSSGPVVVMVLEGNEAISVTRKITGSTEPRKSDPSSIRGALSVDSYDLADEKKRAVKNLVHASEDRATAEREIGVWFKPNEIMDYKRADESAMY
ncbi:MAG: nucleoside-diphosphate kinase [Candidatus Micrarchaeota archaeon]|nr:nucleoside-diphosphate kinase [Candidatus Micrarchaeota archaeon]